MSFLETPIIWSPKSDNWQLEVDKMIERSIVTSQLNAGMIDAEYYLDFLAQQELDIQSFLDGWADEFST